MKIMQITLMMILGFTLSACATPLPSNTVVKDKIVMMVLPDDSFTIPNNVDAPPSNASQKDVANWIVKNDARTSYLENKILELKQVYASTYALLVKQFGNDSVVVVDPSKATITSK